MIIEFVTNPETGRQIKVGGSTYKALIKAGYDLTKPKKAAGKKSKTTIKKRLHKSPIKGPAVEKIITDPAKGEADLYILTKKTHEMKELYFRSYDDVVSYINHYLGDPDVVPFPQYTKDEFKKELYSGTGHQYFFKTKNEGPVSLYLSFAKFQ